MGYITYRANNSGGGWWLKDEDWVALERVGWIVHWVHAWDAPDHTHSESIVDEWSKQSHHHGYSDELVSCVKEGTGDQNRWLDALATSATATVGEGQTYPTPEEAVEEFEWLTGQNVNDQGCNCCGPPHSFTHYDNMGNSHILDVRPTQFERNWF